MAAQRIDISTSLKIKVENGTTSSGDVKYATRTLNSVNPEITDDDLLALGQEFGALQAHEIGAIQRSETATLIS